MLIINKEFRINTGSTISIDLKYEDEKGNKLQIDEAYYTLFNKDTGEIILENVSITDETLLIGSEISLTLNGYYIVKVTIKNNDFTDVYNLGLFVS